MRSAQREDWRVHVSWWARGASVAAGDGSADGVELSRVVSAVEERSGYVAHFFSPAAQLTTSVISAVESAVLTRKRWPSADMS